MILSQCDESSNAACPADANPCGLLVTLVYTVHMHVSTPTIDLARNIV